MLHYSSTTEPPSTPSPTNMPVLTIGEITGLILAIMIPLTVVSIIILVLVRRMQVNKTVYLDPFQSARAPPCCVFQQDSQLIVPPCVKPTATLPHCTSEGIEYNDEWNDFTLKIPQGAIPEGESLTIDIGVALYGPFQYPEGLRPVSPVFWICV